MKIEASGSESFYDGSSDYSGTSSEDLSISPSSGAGHDFFSTNSSFAPSTSNNVSIFVMQNIFAKDQKYCKHNLLIGI